MATILTMIDIIYPKLRKFTNGVRTAAAIIVNMIEEPEEEAYFPQYSGYGGGDNSRWGPDNSKWGSKIDHDTWKSNLRMFDSDSEDEDDNDVGDDEDDEEREQEDFTENRLVPVGKIVNNKKESSRSQHGNKPLRSRIASILRKLILCVPPKRKI